MPVPWLMSSSVDMATQALRKEAEEKQRLAEELHKTKQSLQEVLSGVMACLSCHVMSCHAMGGLALTSHTGGVEGPSIPEECCQCCSGVSVRVRNGLRRRVVLSLLTTRLLSICQELLVHALLLDCGHSFCYGCLMDWMRGHEVHNHGDGCAVITWLQECPTCRAPVKGKPQRMFNLDAAISEMVKNMDPERSAQGLCCL